MRPGYIIAISGAYQLLVLAACAAAIGALHLGTVPEQIAEIELVATCALLGGMGGSIYCTKGIYTNVGKGSWNPDWIAWYFLRPPVSVAVGGLSTLALHAGLLVLSQDGASTPNLYAFYAVAFVAGYNVDGFLRRIESATSEALNVTPSRSGRAEDESSDIGRRAR